MADEFCSFSSSTFLDGHSKDLVGNWTNILKQILKERLLIMATGWARQFAHYMIIFQSLCSNISHEFCVKLQENLMPLCLRN